MKNNLSFTEGPVGQQLYLMSVPMAWGLLATMSFNAVDTYFVSRLGNDALAAMSFTFPVVMLITNMAIGLGAGASSLIARLLGRSEHSQARQVAADTLVFTLLLSLLAMWALHAFMGSILQLLGAQQELVPLINQYMQVWLLSVPAILLPMVMSAMMRASGNSHIAGRLMIVAALINVVLDPLLIFGWGPIPSLGIAGAAWATVITRCLLVIITGYYLCVRLGLISRPHWRWKPLCESVKGILHVGLPAMGTNMIIPMASGVTLSLVARHGVDAVAGFGVAMRIEPVLLIPFYALSSVISPFMGQNMAQPERQKKGLQVATRFCLVFGIAVTMLLAFCGELISGWFSDSRSVVSVAATYFVLVPVSYAFYGLVMSLNASFNGIGLPFPAMVISLMRVLGLYVPFALVLQHFWQWQGLFMAISLANMCAAVWGYLWLKRRILNLQV